MSDPLVTCVLLTADRQAMTARAVRCFLAQTYERKALLIFDTGRVWGEGSTRAGEYKSTTDESSIDYKWSDKFRGATIGALRNAGNELARGSDIIAHWDSDDWSHPYRLAEQVNLLQASQADAVGYHDMLMWHGGAANDIRAKVSGRAHLYRYDGPQAVTAYALETSLLYWRRAWEKLKFDDSNFGDRNWVRQVRCASRSSGGMDCQCGQEECASNFKPHFVNGRMIAEIHGGNTVMRPDLLSANNFTRVPEWDSYCRERMSL
jgi:hypothetical protein